MNTLRNVTQEIDLFHGYTRVWMEQRAAARLDTNYNCLAVALAAKPEAQGLTLEQVIALAVFCQRTYLDLRDERYQRRRTALETRGWSFTFDGYLWSGEAPGLGVKSTTIDGVLEEAAGWGETIRESWRQHRVQRPVLEEWVPARNARKRTLTA